MDVEKFEYLKNIALAVIKELAPVLSEYEKDIESVTIIESWNEIVIDISKYMRVRIYVDKDYDIAVEFGPEIISRTTLSLLNQIFETIEKVLNRQGYE